MYFEYFWIFASKFHSNFKFMQIFLEFLETQFQNVTILLEKIYLSQLTACIIARVCSSNFFTFIMKHPVDVI